MHDAVQLMCCPYAAAGVFRANNFLKICFVAHLRAYERSEGEPTTDLLASTSLLSLRVVSSKLRDRPLAISKAPKAFERARNTLLTSILA